MNVHDSDLLKIRDALAAAEKFLVLRDEMNGSVHLAGQVRFSPLTSEVIAARERVDELVLSE